MNEQYELYHHGIRGMKWGIRRFQKADGSLTSAGKKRYDVGEATSKVKEAKTARNEARKKYILSSGFGVKPAHKNLKTANQNLKSAKKELSEAKKQAKTDRKDKLKTVDPELAKNKQTKRVALDYHNLSDDKFRRKYKTSKDKFAKRYVKSDGDTYTRGKRKAIASALIMAHSSDVHYLDLRTGKVKTVKMGKAAAAKTLAMDLALSEAVTRYGYNKAEQRYNDKKKQD